jgi:hypothetical protein
VEGRVEKYKDEVCLMRQTYIRDESLTIEKLILAERGCHWRKCHRSTLPALGTGRKHESELSLKSQPSGWLFFYIVCFKRKILKWRHEWLN